MYRKNIKFIASVAIITILLVFRVVGAVEKFDAENSRLTAADRRPETPNMMSSAIIPNVPDPGVVLQGGDDISTATQIPDLPFHDTGVTTGYNDDYDELCFWESTSPDVVYSYQVEADMNVCITLCDGSEYDTKLFVYENTHMPGDPYACNDDACPEYLSRIENLFLTAGNTYYIVIDGYGGNHGSYVLDVFELIDCVTCPTGATPEGEPVCYDDYEDNFNGGCGSNPTVFGNISCGETVCGTSGTFLFQSSQYRDTD